MIVPASVAAVHIPVTIDYIRTCAGMFIKALQLLQIVFDINNVSRHRSKVMHWVARGDTLTSRLRIYII